MKVLWKGSIELESHRQKITLEVPEDSLDEFDLMKREIRRGKAVELVIAEDKEEQGEDKLNPVIGLAIVAIKQAYEQGRKDAGEFKIVEQIPLEGEKQ